MQRALQPDAHRAERHAACRASSRGARSTAARRNQLTVGAAYDESHAHFTQSSQFGYLTPDRGVATVDGPGAFADGTQDSEGAFDARVDLTGRTHTSERVRERLRRL